MHNYSYLNLNKIQLDIMKHINFHMKWIYLNINHKNLLLNIYHNFKHCKHIYLNLIYIRIGIPHIIEVNYISNIQSHIKSISLHLGNNHSHIRKHKIVKSDKIQGCILYIRIINSKLNNYHNYRYNNLWNYNNSLDIIHKENYKICIISNYLSTNINCNYLNYKLIDIVYQQFQN